MTYIQIEDAFFDHPKVLRVSKDAKLLAVAAICYCGRELTDGFIPAGAVPVLAAKTGVSKPTGPVKELLDARLWEIAEGGYLAHDYLVYNASAEKVRANREATRERMRRLRAPNVRAHNDQTTGAHESNNDQSAPNVRDSTTTTTTRSNERDLPPSVPLENSEQITAPKRKHRLPDEWSPTDKQREALGEAGYSATEIDHELPLFRNHHGHKGDTGLNWALSFTNWMAKSREFNRPRIVGINGMPPEIERLPWNNAQRMKWENDHRSQAS